MKNFILLCGLFFFALIVNGQQVITTWINPDGKEVPEAKATAKKVVTISGDTATTIQTYWFKTKHEKIQHFKNGFPSGIWSHKTKGKVQKEYDFSQMTYLTETQVKEREKLTDTTGVVPPLFPGGHQARITFMQNNIRYPRPALEGGYQGISYISFSVKPDGKLTSFAVVKSSNPYLDLEACRVIRSMPEWIPATRNGEPIEFTVTLPVKFTLITN